VGAFISALTEALHRSRRAAALTVRALSEAQAERAKTQQDLVRYAERLRILLDIDQAILNEHAPVALAAAVLPRLRDLLGVRRAIVNLFDLDAGEAEWLAAVGRKRLRLGPGVRFPLALMGDVAALGRGESQIVDTGALPSSPHADALRASGVLTYMVIPMIAGGELIGAVSFGGPTAEFPEEQVSIAREAAAHIAIGLAHARLHERVTRQAEELEGGVAIVPG
jgi:GAF domain-containing protein